MIMDRTRSSQLYERACGVMPGGVNSPVRAFRSVGGTPVFVDGASGATFTDADGNTYVDFCLSWGPLILGHGHPAVVEAVRAAAGRGLSYGACHEAEATLARRVLEAFPAMEQVRMVSSGTEAVMTALRIARGATGRSTILKFEGGYHGHSDGLLVKAGSGLATFGTSSSLGVPEGFARDTLVLPFDDLDVLEEAFARRGRDLACVVVEPLPGNNGLLEQRREWLERLRSLTSEHGVLLVFDEVISGFRLHYGGYGARVGITPDLTTLGKIIGGGMPVGAVAGPRRFMKLLSPEGDVYQAGTLSGNPVAMAAGIATLEVLRDGDVYEALEALGRTFDEALESHARTRPWLRARRIGSLVWFHLDACEVPRRADAVSARAIERFNSAYHALLDRGLYLPPSGYEVVFLCAAHTHEQVRTLVDEVARHADVEG
jgi:glutamate-1-semialdehyde 2,1-aminomutase